MIFRLSPTRRRRLACLAAAWTVAVVGVLPAADSDGPATAPVPALKPKKPAPAVCQVRLDLEALVHAPALIADRVEDDLWSVSPQQSRSKMRRQTTDSSRRTPRSTNTSRFQPGGGSGQADTAKPFLVRLPVRVLRPEEPVTLDGRALRIRGGKFVAWMLRDGQQAAQGPGRLGRHQEDSAQVDPDVPPGAPTLARQISVEPSGTGALARWKLEKAIPGGELKQTESGYDMKLDRKRIIEVKFGAGSPPKRQRSRTANKQAAEDMRRQRADYNRKVKQLKSQNAAQIRRLNGQLARLPAQFSMPLPEQIWGVFSMKGASRDLVIDGPTIQRLSIGFDQLEDVRALASAGRNRSRDREPTNLAGLLDKPTGALLLAYALSTAQVSDMKVGDSLFGIIESLIDSKDDLVRKKTIQALLEMPATDATAKLVAIAVPQMDHDAKLQWLYRLLGRESTASAARGGSMAFMPGLPPTGTADRSTRTSAQGLSGPLAMLSEALAQAESGPQEMPAASGGRREPPGLARPMTRSRSRGSGGTDPKIALDAVNQLLRDEDGPSADLILAALIEQAPSVGTGRSRRSNQTAPTSVFRDGVHFDVLEGSRLDDAIARILAEAGGNDLAAYWLQTHLLGERARRQTQLRTMQILARSYGWHDPVGAVYDGLADEMFGPPGLAGELPRVRLSQPLPIDSSRHGIFQALQHGDDQIRQMAWQSLPRFRIATAAGRGGRREAAADDPLDTLLDVARGQQEPRPQLVGFLQHIDDQRRSTDALIELATEPAGPAARLAVGALIGSHRDLGGALDRPEMRSNDLATFIDGVYEVTFGAPSPVGTLAVAPEHRSRLIRWFAERVAEGRVPAESEWAVQFQRPGELLEMAVGPDAEMSTAAAAALATSAGAAADEGREVARRLKEAAGSDETDLQEVWQELRHEIFARRIEKSAGPHRLVMRIYGEPDPLAAPAAGPGLDRMPGRAPAGMPGRFPGGPMMMGRGSRFAAASELPEGVEPSVDRSLGIVSVTVEDGVIVLGNGAVEAEVGEEQLAIVISQPGDMANLSDDLEPLALDSLDRIDLLPHPSGWRGVFGIADGRTVELLLEHVEP